ncbi:NAD(P)-dependent oxidoreductase, partial [Staphylococcus aureus]
GTVTLSACVTAFVHRDDAVETAIQAIHFENGIYNVEDDAPVKGSEFAEWYKEQLGVEANIDIQPAQPFERGVSNEKFNAQGGT